MRPQDLGFGRLFEGVRDAVIVADATTGGIVLWNPAAAEIFGYPLEEALGMNVEELVPGPLKGRHRVGMSRYRDTGHGPYVDSRTVLELPALRKGGGEISVELTLSPITPSGEAAATEERRFVLAIVRDVTRRKKAEEGVRRLNEELEERVKERTAQLRSALAELKKSEQRARLLVESVEDYAIFMADAEGRVADWNVGAERIFGYREDEIVGKEGSILFTPEDRAQGVPERELGKAAQEGRARDERWHLRKDGTRFWASGFVRPVRDEAGILRGFAKVARDYTEHRRAEEERERLLHESERRAAELGAVIASIPDAVYIGSESGIHICNDAALQMLGFVSIAELNQNIPLLSERLQNRFAATGEHIPPEEEPFARALRGETVVEEVIARHLQTGRDVIVRCAAAPIVHEGSILGAVAVNTDITERKRAEEELQRSNERITNILESITDAFFALDNQWRFAYLNRQAGVLLQRPRAELLGKNVWEEYPEAVGSTFYEKYHEALASGEAVQFEEYYVPLGGWFEVKAYPSEEGLSVYFRDVTKRRRTQESLRRYAAILDATTDFVGTVHTSGRVLSLNRAGRRMMGIGDEEDVSRTTIADYHPDWASSVILEQGVPAAIRQGSWSGETALLSRDGREIPISQVILAHRGEQGEVEYLSTIARDISERKHTEEQFRVRTLQQAAVAELGRTALAEDDLQKLMEVAVGSVARTLGVEYCKVLELLPDGEKLLLRTGVGWKEGLVGRATVGAGVDSQAGYTLLSDEPTIVEDLRSESRFSGPPLLHEHGVVSGMSAVIRGHERPFGVLGAHTKERRVFTDDDVNFLRAVANTLAAAIERKRAEEELREQEALFRSLSASSPVGIFLTDLQGRCTYTNPRCQEICGFSFEEALGEGWANFVHPEDRGWVFEEWAGYVREGREYSEEIRFVNPRNGTRWVYVRSSPMFSGEDELIGHVGTVEDITERKRAEEAMAEVREAERHRMARDLHDGVLQDLSYTAAAMGLVMLEGEGTNLEGRLQGAIDSIRRAAEGLRAAVYDLRLADELDQPFPRLVESLVERNRAMAKGCEMRLVVGRGVPSQSFGGSGMELLRILQEALTNARRHSGANNVLVSLRVEESYLVAVVSDDGRGLGPETVRGVGTRSMRERVALLGGELTVESELGEGTRVVVRVPMSRLLGRELGSEANGSNGADSRE